MAYVVKISSQLRETEAGNFLVLVQETKIHAKLTMTDEEIRTTSRFQITDDIT